MIHRLLATTIGAFALVMPLVVANPAAADDPPDELDSLMHDQVADLLAVRAARADHASPAGTPTKIRSVRPWVSYVMACQGNAPGAPMVGDARCRQAAERCADPQELAYWVYIAPGDVPRQRAVWVLQPGILCRGVVDPADSPVPVMTVEDFRRLPIKPGEVNVQPANQRTLVNIPTNVYVTADAQVLPTELLGIPIQVRATPTLYTWTFGDGGTLTTADQGAAYPDLRTTHTYRKAGRADVRLTTSYTGEYSVDGGVAAHRRPADVTSPATTLTVQTARTELVS